MSWTAIVKKPYKYRGTCLRGRQVTVIVEEIYPEGEWACKIRVKERKGLYCDFWIYDRDLLVTTEDPDLAKAIYG